jgi:hypothetical protein
MEPVNITKFIFKYLFILKAAADGWRIRYLGDNSFQFTGRKRRRLLSASEFVEKYGTD